MEIIDEVDVDLGVDRAGLSRKANGETASAAKNETTPSSLSKLNHDLDNDEDLELDGDSGIPSFAALDADSPGIAFTGTSSQPGFQLPIVFSRTLARLVDLLWQVSLAWLIVRTVLPIGEMSLFARALIVVFALLPLALVLDSLVQGICGNTPGKKLIGIQAVTWRGRPLSIVESLARNFLVWRFGFLFGIVPLVPFTAIRQWQLVIKGYRTNYDEQLHLRTRGYERPVWLSVLATAVAITVLSLPLSHLVFGEPAFNSAGTAWWNGFIRKTLGTQVVEPTQTLQGQTPRPLIDGALIRPRPETDRNPNPMVAQSVVWPENAAADSVDLTPEFQIQTAPPKVGTEFFKIQAALALTPWGAATTAQLLVAPTLSTSISPKVGPEDPTTHWWTNPYTGLTTAIDATWETVTTAGDEAIEFQHIGTEAVLTLVRLGPTELTPGQLAEQHTATHTEYGLAAQQREILVAELPGQQLVASPSAVGGLVRTSEWVRIDDMVYHLELVSRSATLQTIERLKVIIWSTFI